MGSETPLKLPAVDFSELDLIPGSLGWNSVKAKVRQAFEEYGCFEATFDKIPLELRKALLGASEQLFDLPLQTKLRNTSKKPFQGYVGQLPGVPLFESMGFVEAPTPEKVQDFTDLLWPQGNPEFCKTVQSFSEQLSELDQIIGRMVLESFGLEKYMDEHMDSTTYALRFMKYKGLQTTDTENVLSAHTDSNLVTILYGNEVEGLEVQTKSGEWIKVKPSANSFTVMIGDSQYAWMNGWLNSASHRVTMAGKQDRYTVGLFSFGKQGYMIKCPEELVDEDHPLLFKPFDYDEFLEFYNPRAGKIEPQDALKAFCGV